MSATSPKSERRLQGGFTLLELLLAMTLLVVLCGTLYASYFTLVRGRERAGEGMESRRELRTTLDLLRRELSSLLYRNNDKRLRFVVEDRDRYGKPASALAFTAIAPPDAGGNSISDQIDVSYGVVEKGGKMVLARESRELRFSAKGLRYPQMEHLEGFLVECLSGDKWVKSWDTAINMNLPKAVRVTLTVQEDGKPVEYSVIAIPRIGAS